MVEVAGDNYIPKDSVYICVPSGVRVNHQKEGRETKQAKKSTIIPIQQVR